MLPVSVAFSICKQVMGFMLVAFCEFIQSSKKKFSRGSDVTVNIQNSPHFHICHYKPLTQANWSICDDYGFSAEHREALKPLCKN